jgi:hypothetical protein
MVKPVKYKEYMTVEDLDVLLAEISALEEAYAFPWRGETFDENDLEDWTEKERRAMLP